MEINNSQTVAEVTSAFEAYEAALTANDLAGLDTSFWDSPFTVRYGVGENLYGIEEVRAFRAKRLAGGLVRRLERTVITTFGQDFATASTLFTRDSAPGYLGRQMQSWVRTDAGWRVVAASVSVIPVKSESGG